MIGIWIGNYQYDNGTHQEYIGHKKTNFTIYIEDFTGNRFKGIVQDDFETGGMREPGKIAGSVSGDKIEFVKKMPFATFRSNDKVVRRLDRKHPDIIYRGILSADNKIASGKWTIQTTFWLLGIIPFPARSSGTWEMRFKTD